MKIRNYRIPAIGLAADWPGSCTQTYAQLDTEAGPHGFDQNYFVQEVAGLSQLAGELMLVKPIVIDLGWGELKSALIQLTDSDFVARQNSAAHRQTLVNQYIAAFRKIEVGQKGEARNTLKGLAANASAWIAAEKRAAVNMLVDSQISKLA